MIYTLALIGAYIAGTVVACIIDQLTFSEEDIQALLN